MSGPDSDPVEYFLEDMEFHGRSIRTRTAYERVLAAFVDHLDGRGTRPRDATHRECLMWVHRLRSTHSESTVATYASYVHRFYAYMTQIGAFETNPMTLVMEEMDETIDTDPSRREISVLEMRAFVGDIRHPLRRAVVVVLLKTGLRVGELCNLDRTDLYLEDAVDGETHLRPQLGGKGESIFVSPDRAYGAVTDGEVRSASNKRKRATIVPVDDEVKAVLQEWLAIRPEPISEASPLFCSTAKEWGARLTPHMVHHFVEAAARERGWYRQGGGAAENVTPHYFRHFFTTHLRDRTGDRGIVKYLRGDVADDIIDTYTHNWGDQVRETYESNIYSLLSTA
ncbi:tyrosine-type recombinase/integrase [Haloferacaceae archaeon DSL9]